MFMHRFYLQLSIHIRLHINRKFDMFMTSDNHIMGLTCLFKNSLTELISKFWLNNNCCLITIGISTVAVIKNSEQSFNIFDVHSSDLHGMLPFTWEMYF